MSNPHEMNVRVYYADTDAAGIVYYANYLKFAESARTEFLRDLGYDRDKFATMSPIKGFAVLEVTVKYKAPAKLEDLLTVKTKVTEIGGASLKMHQAIYRDDQLLVDMNVILVCVDKNLRPSKIPQELREVL